MRSLTLILFLVGCSITAYNQSSVNEFYQKYKSQENASETEQIKWLNKLIPKEIRNSELRTLLADPNKVQIIVLESTQVQPADLKQLRKQANSEELDLLIRAKDQGERLDLFARASDGYIRQVLYLVEEDDNFVFLNLSGKWTFKDFMGKDRREAY